jgi:photosystem II stability/assembly factor-like uncharacterized protein
VTVLPCDGLDPEKGWEKITPPGDLGDTQAIAVDPFAPGTVYVHMHKGGNGGHAETDGIYKSNDCGSTWERIASGQNASDGGGTNIHTGSLVAIIVDWKQQGVMYTASNYGPTGIYRSRNGGVDWDQVLTEDVRADLPSGGWINGLSVDPTDPRHLVGATHTGCEGAFAPNCLAETRDGGDTWRLIPIPKTGNEQCGVYIKDASTMLYVSGQEGVFLTTNNTPENPTPTWTKVGDGANGADTGLFAYQASDEKYYLPSDYGVLVGSSDFLTWTLDSASPRLMPFIVGNGETMFGATRGATFYTASEDDPLNWSELDAGGSPPSQAGRWLIFEPEHRVLYSSSWDSGLYRLTTD